MVGEIILGIPIGALEPVSFGAWPAPSAAFVADLFGLHQGDVAAVQYELLTLAIDYETMARTGPLTPTGARNATNYAEALFNQAILLGRK